MYSDPEVYLALCNLHRLILKKKGIKECDVSGDGTGYSLSISKHYREEVNQRGDKVKEKSEEKEQSERKAFVYTFCLIDLDTKMYLCYGTGMRSEKEAFKKAMRMLGEIDVRINSVRLDKYYSYPSIVDMFANARFYLIPKKNCTTKGSKKWKRMLSSFLSDPFTHLKEYFRRNNSESGFSADKRRFGWMVRQRRDDRIDIAQFSNLLWHNLFLLGA